MVTVYWVEEVGKDGFTLMHRCPAPKDAKMHAERLAAEYGGEFRVTEKYEKIIGHAWGNGDGKAKWMPE